MSTRTSSQTISKRQSRTLAPRAQAAKPRVAEEAGGVTAASPIVGLPWGCWISLPPLSANNMWKAGLGRGRGGKPYPTIYLDPRVQQWKDDMLRLLAAADIAAPRLRQHEQVWLIVNSVVPADPGAEPDVVAYLKITVDMLAALFSRGARSEEELWNDRYVRRIMETKWPEEDPGAWGVMIEVHPWLDSPSGRQTEQ